MKFKEISGKRVLNFCNGNSEKLIIMCNTTFNEIDIYRKYENENKES